MPMAVTMLDTTSLSLTFFRPMPMMTHARRTRFAYPHVPHGGTLSRRSGAPCKGVRVGLLVGVSYVCHYSLMLGRSVGYLLFLLAVVSVIPAALVLLLLASGATVGAQGHWDLFRLGASLGTASVLFLGSRPLLSRG